MIRLAIQFGLFVATLLLMASCNFNENLVIGSGNVITENRPVNEAFTKIEAGEATTVYLEKSDTPYIRVEADDNLIPYISTKISNNKLTIGMSSICISKSNARTVYVGLPELTDLEVTSASSVVGKTLFVADELHVKASSAGSAILEVEAGRITVDANSASNITLRGKALDAVYDASSASTIDAEELMANTIQAESSSAANILCRPLANLRAVANSAGSIEYVSIPKEINVKSNSGGSIRQK